MIIKNSNLRRTLFENRYKILGIIIAIILVFAVIQLLNQIAKSNLDNESSSSNTTTTTTSQSSYKPEETVIERKRCKPGRTKNKYKYYGQFY